MDVYLTTSTYRGDEAVRIPLSQLDLATIDYFGGQHANELLGQFETLRAGEPYDGVLVITDGMGFELGASPVQLPAFDFPIWMVHMAGELPLGYDDATLAAVQASGGSVVGSVDELWPRFLVAQGDRRDTTASARTDLVDGYLWTTVPADAAVTGSERIAVDSTDGFAAFAARHLILDAMHRQRAGLDGLTNLDQLHAIAKEHAIVTPYSSMIVLVNSDQQRRLSVLEQAGHRFEREGEAAGETVPESLTNVTAVPEPHEWLLLGLAVVMLGWYVRKRRLQPQSQRVIV